MAEESTLVLVKPDAISHCGSIRLMYEHARPPLRIVREVFWGSFPLVLAEALYVEHVGEDFYPRLIAHVANRPVLAFRVTGESAVARVRELNGATDPLKAATGTIRRHFGSGLPANAVHGSASLEEAAEELRLIFGQYR